MKIYEAGGEDAEGVRETFSGGRCRCCRCAVKMYQTAGEDAGDVR